MKRTIIPLCLAFVLTNSAFADFDPIAITPGSFNADIVVEKTAPPHLFSATTASMDGGTNNTAFTWYEQGYNTNSGATTTGLPVAGSTFTSANFADHQYTMPPTYAGNNAVLISAQVPTGTLTFTTPTAFPALSFLTSAGGGDVTINYTITYADTSTEAASFSSPDWFNGATAAYVANGRLDLGGGGFGNINGGAVKLFAAIINVGNPSIPIASVTFNYASGGRAAIFAVSGHNGISYVPIAVTGFNKDMVVEANGPRAVAMTNVTTVSMDGGTNNTANTWYEQGYYTLFPNTGLPQAGSTINSAAQPDHHYTMPSSYVGNNAIYVDTNAPVANITIASPAAYSALSFLSATANGTVTNQCIMQYADGTSETNTFLSRDWFGNTPVAYTANGRVNLNNRTLNNVNNNNPRLYEAQFALGNTTSPITNVVLKWLGAGSVNARVAVLAVSGTAGAVPPIIGTQPQSINVFEGTNITFTAIITGGTAPITYQWQKGTNGVFVNLTDGGNISGANTPSLVLTGVILTNAGDYKLVASNVAGPVNSAVATLGVFSAFTDVTSPTDIVSSFSGTVSANEPVTAAINNDVGLKYLNFGIDGDTAAPFVGPVGLVVTPGAGSTIVKGIRFYAANDAADRDPADYTLEGSNDGGANYTLISSGSLALPAGRNTATATPDPRNQNVQEVNFANTSGYTSYRLSFNNVKNNAAANSMQIGEVEILGTLTPIPPSIIRQPVAAVKVFVGSSPTFSVAAGGPPPLTYQWYVNGTTPISGATNAGYTLNNAQLSDSGKSLGCTVSNQFGTTPSTTTLLTVVPAPTQAYPSAVLANNPMAFWRLNEGPDDFAGNNNTLAQDYRGGHAGQYSNVVLQLPGYNPTADPDPAVQFGVFTFPNSYIGNISGIDFSTPTNSSVSFSVEAWVNGPIQNSDAGIVTKGAGGGGEQFNLDTGGTTNRGFRFFVRDVSGGTHGAFSSVPLDEKWHHVVGVCDEVNSNVVLYVDGLLVSTASISPSNGLLSSSSPVSIGGRQSGSGTVFNNVFIGSIDEVAIYNFALSSNQVLNHYYAATPAPKLTLNPTNATIPENTAITFSSAAYGPGTLSYQWYDVTGGGFTALAGKTSPDLALAAVPAIMDQTSYQVVVSSAYGSVTSSIATLTVIGGPPSILADLPSQGLVYAGRTAVLPVTVGGTAPFTFQWQKDGVNLNDGGRISGAHSNVLSIANAQTSDTGDYQLLISNAQAGPVLSTIESLFVQTRPGFNTNGLGWSLNGGPSIANNVLTLTDGAVNENRSSYYPFPLYIGTFSASFLYQNTTVGGGGADGMAFILQNSPAGTTALGGGGGGLGYTGITPSAALMMNIYEPNTAGIALRANGATGAPYTATTPVDISTGNPIQIDILYTQGNLRVTLKDTVTSGTFTTNMTIALPAILGADTAYVGLSGASGGTASAQQVSNFTFISYPGLTAQLTGSNLLFSWPATIGGYVLQATPDLTTPNWQTVAGTITQVNGQNQISVPVAAGNRFFRLTLP